MITDQPFRRDYISMMFDLDLQLWQPFYKANNNYYVHPTLTCHAGNAFTTETGSTDEIRAPDTV